MCPDVNEVGEVREQRNRTRTGALQAFFLTVFPESCYISAPKFYLFLCVAGPTEGFPWLYILLYQINYLCLIKCKSLLQNYLLMYIWKKIIDLCVWISLIKLTKDITIHYLFFYILNFLSFNLCLYVSVSITYLSSICLYHFSTI